MESCLFLHLLYMRPLLTFIFCLLSASMFAQVKFRQELSEAVRTEVLDTLKPGELRIQIFELDSLKRLIPYSDPEFSYLISESKLSALIEKHQDSLGKNYSRCIYLYNDLYENHLEIAIAPYYWDEAQEIFAEFPEGYNKFRKTVINDIRSALMGKDIRDYDWKEPLYLVVNKRGVLEFEGENKIISLLDTSRTKRWWPHIKGGRPVPSVFKLTFDFAGQQMNADNLRVELEEIYNALNKTLYGKRIIERQFPYPESKDSKEIVVSFLSSPENMKVKLPVIPRGDEKKARELITFLEKYYAGNERVFEVNYLSNWRVFFTIEDWEG